MLIRNRKPTDDQRIYTLVKNAFAAMEQASGDEQNLVGRLRQSAGYVPELELIAEQDEIIVGHIMLTKIRIGNTEQLILAPLAVAPDRQGRGIGGALIRAAHTAAEQAGYSLIVLVGHPTYYPRFGYRPASEFGLTCAPEIPPEYFMALDLTGKGVKFDAFVAFPPVFFEAG